VLYHILCYVLYIYKHSAVYQRCLLRILWSLYRKCLPHKMSVLYHILCYILYIYEYLATCRENLLRICGVSITSVADIVFNCGYCRVSIMGWLRLVGSLKLKVAFAKEPYKRDDILQKRPVILRSLLMVATPYIYL